MVNGSTLFQQLLIIVQMVSAFFLAVGYYTTTNTVVRIRHEATCTHDLCLFFDLLVLQLSWYLHVSQQIRNPLVLHNGDVYIRCYLFFAMFLPLGACLALLGVDEMGTHSISCLGKVWSVDNWLKGKPKKQRVQPYLANCCTVATLIMLSIVYVASFIHKYRNAWNVWFVTGTRMRAVPLNVASLYLLYTQAMLHTMPSICDSSVVRWVT